MDTTQVMQTRTRSTTYYYGGLVVAAFFLLASQVMLGIVIPASGLIPPPSLIALGSVLTLLSLPAIGAMIYGMMLRNKGQ